MKLVQFYRFISIAETTLYLILMKTENFTYPEKE